ncbi:MAG: hypothetical protein V1837_02800 [Candidatus Woesearchaeota archaeon]
MAENGAKSLDDQLAGPIGWLKGPEGKRIVFFGGCPGYLGEHSQILLAVRTNSHIEHKEMETPDGRREDVLEKIREHPIYCPQCSMEIMNDRYNRSVRQFEEG